MTMPSIDIIEALIRMTVIRLRSWNAVEREQTAVVASDKPNAAEPEPEQDLLTDYYILKPLAPINGAGGEQLSYFVWTRMRTATE